MAQLNKKSQCVAFSIEQKDYKEEATDWRVKTKNILRLN